MPYCSNCGSEVEENTIYCPHCGEGIEGKSTKGAPRAPMDDARAADHLSLGLNLAISRPMVFAPVIIGGLISSIVEGWGQQPINQGGDPPFVFFGVIISLIGAVINFILNFAAIDMARDAYLDEPMDLSRSFNYAFGRFGTFFIASIVAGIMSITIILIPVAILMMVIIVMDETGIVDAVSQSFSVLGRDLGDIVVILIVAIIGYALLSFVPLIGSLLTAGFGVILNFAFIDVYHNFKSNYGAF